jgi:hypothetical protein
MATSQLHRLVAALVIAGGLCAVPAHAGLEAIDDNAAEIFGGPALGDELLDASRGGADLELNKIRSDGVVRDNQAYNLTTGSNLITEGAFSAANGFSTVIQNSGNNVLIQNSTIINLHMQ